MRQDLYGIPRKIKYFTHDEERALLAEYKAGDIQARNKLLEGKYHFIIKTVSKFHGHKYGADDIFQDAIIGAIQGIDKWNPDRGALSTCMYQYIKQHVIKHISIAEIPVSMPELYYSYRSAVLKESRKENPDYSRFINNSCLPKTYFKEIIAAFCGYTTIESIEKNTDINKEAMSIFADTRIKFVDDILDKNENDALLNELKNIFSQLTKKQRNVIKKLHGIECDKKTGHELAKDLKVNHQAVYRMHMLTLQEIKRRHPSLAKWMAVT